MNEIAISLKNVSKYYKLYDRPKDRLKEALNRSGKIYHHKFYATKNLNLDIKKGEIIGIVGKNGSGKSTLLKLITGVLTPDEGSIKVNGHISALLELGSGFNPDFTGMQNIFFYGTILGFSKEEMQKRVDDILAFADIGEFIDQPLKTYSSGMKSRLGFAVAVHIDPEILILDEVLAVGDVLFRRKCYAKMEEFFKGGKTIIYVSHDANSVNELCTRAVFLHEGNILIDSDAKTVTTLYLKYLLSNKEAQIEILHEITTLSHSSIQNKEKDSENLTNLKEDKNTIKQPIEMEENDYIENFKSSPNSVNNDIALFQNVHIINKEMKQVNQLSHLDHYTIQSDITFQVEMHNVSIGIQIYTIKGVLVSGANMKHYMNYTIPSVDQGDQYNIQWEFDCFLLPGEYIIVIFMEDAAGNTAVQYDASIFKVKQTSFSQGGYVTLNQKITLNKRNKEI